MEGQEQTSGRVLHPPLLLSSSSTELPCLGLQSWVSIIPLQPNPTLWLWGGDSCLGNTSLCVCVCV